MNTYEWGLNILKYTGLLIATGSSIWSATNIVSKEIEGRKRLTFEGKVSILFTVIGLLITISSNILQDRYNFQKAEKASIKELNKTNRIILAGQPLLSLNFKLKLDNKDQEFNDFILEVNSNEEHYKFNNSHGEISGSKGQAIYLYNNFFPLINASLKKSLPKDIDPFLFLISLDNEQTAILSFGYLDSSTKLPKGRFPEGIYLSSDLAGALYNGDDRQINNPFFQNKHDSLSINWNINPNTLFKCLNKYNSDIPLTANLPKILKIAFLYDIKTLPFDSSNMTSSNSYNIWDEIDDRETVLNHIYNESSLELVPNQLNDQTVNYALSRVFNKVIVDSEWEEPIMCKSLLLVFKRTED